MPRRNARCGAVPCGPCPGVARWTMLRGGIGLLWELGDSEQRPGRCSRGWCCTCWADRARAEGTSECPAGVSCCGSRGSAVVGSSSLGAVRLIAGSWLARRGTAAVPVTCLGDAGTLRRTHVPSEVVRAALGTAERPCVSGPTRGRAWASSWLWQIHSVLFRFADQVAVPRNVLIGASPFGWLLRLCIG